MMNANVLHSVAKVNDVLRYSGDLQLGRISIPDCIHYIFVLS